MIRRFALPMVMVLAMMASIGGVSVASGTVPINFTRGTVAGSGFAPSLPTSIAFGPDGRLYVANASASLQALTIDPNTKQVTAIQTITSSANACPTGQSTPAGCIQEIFGIAFDPTDASSPPPIYITNTVSGFGGQGQAPSGTFLGKITKISGPGYVTRTDIITGLPVGNSGHEANGLAFGPDGRLYIDQGSMTNRGLVNPLTGLFQRPEVPTSGAMLVADIKALGFNGNITYSPAATYGDTVDQTGGDVSVYASGLRNPYDLVFHSNGKLYSTDNGPNGGYGPPSTDCTTAGPDAPDVNDELNLIVAGNYYGHPNRNRGRTDPRQCTYHPGTEASNGGYTAPIEANLDASSDGLAEYTSNKFGGQMQGDLLYVSWVKNTLHRVKLSANGQAVVSDTTLATGLAYALDVAVSSDGTIFVAEYGGVPASSKITFFKPDETPVSSISVTAIQPNAGPIAGGSAVTITGTNFTTTAETTVTIGGQALQNMVVQNSTTITGVAPPNTQGLKDVVVTNASPLMTGTLPAAFNYVLGGGTVPPVANAGPDLSTPIAHVDHAHVTLDGRASFDPDGFIVTYQWTEGSTVLSTNVYDSVQLLLGEHLLTLTVTDNDNLVSTDDVRIIVTATAENPQPYWCMDINGDHIVNSADQASVAQAWGKRFGQSGYSRLKDFNGDRIINSGDQAKVSKDFTFGSNQCPLVDQQIRAATKATEDAGFENIQNAINAGYVQVTPFIPGQGRHMVKGSVGGQDLIFDPAAPESLLYEPSPSTPGGWRLGGMMYIIPYNLTSIPPDGFATNEDSWHYHDDLCLWNNYNNVQEGVDQATCMARSGNPVWIPKAGWLVHLWNYMPNPVGRFVEVNNNFVGAP